MTDLLKKVATLESKLRLYDPMFVPDEPEGCTIREAVEAEVFYQDGNELPDPNVWTTRATRYLGKLTSMLHARGILSDADVFELMDYEYEPTKTQIASPPAKPARRYKETRSPR